MKTLFTEMDCKSDQQLLKEINSLFMKLNLASPRTQQAMKELNITKQQCQIKNLSEFLQFNNEVDAMYLNHLQMLKDNLSNLVKRRRAIIGPSIKIAFTTPKKSKQFNFLKKIFDHDLKQVYQSELQIKQQQQRISDKIYKQVEENLRSISNKARTHNHSVDKKLTLFKKNRDNDLDDRLNKSLDFDSKFEPIQKSLQDSKIKFKVMMSSKTQQLLDYHLEQKKNINEKEELRRTTLQFNLENSQRSSHFRKGISSHDRIELVHKQEQEQQQKAIQQIVSQIEKTSTQTSQHQSSLQFTIQKMKEEQGIKFNKVHKNLSSKSLLQLEQESNITQDIQERIIQSNTKVKQRLQGIQSKLKNASQLKQEKQQELLNNYTSKIEKRNETIIEKHRKLRDNLKKGAILNKNMDQQKHQLIIEKDELNQNISKAQKQITSKTQKDIEELLSHLVFN